ncbi:MAG: NAD(P)/FAD-dependent oxidoreductase [Chitinophagales bacterium]|nr:NAD(P)/FAD-dependent oxidoreductase [Chitinophagales bacterium]
MSSNETTGLSPSKKVKTVNIIGAGISGLSLGCYLQVNGYQTQIFEKHNIPGGLCTSWDKSGYTFDGCAHWILGSDTGSSFFKVWNELIDMRKVDWVNHDIRMFIELKNNRDKYGNNTFRFYTNLDKLQAYLIDLAPEDEKEIRNFIKPMRVIQKFDMPPIMDDIPLIPSIIRSLKMARYAEFLFTFLKLWGQTNYTFAAKLKNPFLKEAFQMLYDGEEVNLLVIYFPMASFDKKSAGYPLGGSLKFATRFEQRYLQLGGKIHYHTPVNKIITEGDKAVALEVRHGKIHPSDLTISCADWHLTAFELLGGKFVNKPMLDLKEGRSLEVFYSVMQFSFGINKDLSTLPHLTRYPLEVPVVSPDGTEYTRMEVHIYSYDPTMAPAGKSTVIVSFYTKQREFWIDHRKHNRAEYRRIKNEFAQKIIEQLDERLGGIKEFIEVVDVATPATTLRYTGNWKGSAQGLMAGKNFLAAVPIKTTFPGLKNFYYASHWNRPSGGLPVAIVTARDLAKKICKDDGVKFTASSKS